MAWAAASRAASGSGGLFLSTHEFFIFHILYFILYQVALAAGLEEAGVIGRMAAKERAEEAMKNLQESARILQVSLDQSKSSRGPIVILKHHRSGGT